MKQMFWNVVIGFTMLLMLALTACSPAKPTVQRLQDAGVAKYSGTTASLDSQITKENIRKALTDTAKTALGGADVDLNVTTDYRYSVVFAYSMNNGTKTCKGYQVAHDAVLAIDDLKTDEMFSFTLGVFPIPEDIETITKEVCP